MLQQKRRICQTFSVRPPRGPADDRHTFSHSQASYPTQGHIMSFVINYKNPTARFQHTLCVLHYLQGEFEMLSFLNLKSYTRAAQFILNLSSLQNINMCNIHIAESWLNWNKL